MVDTNWVSVAGVADRLGVSRQAIQRAAPKLSERGLARKDPENGRWEVAASAVDVHASTGSWPRIPGASPPPVQSVDQLRIDLAVAGEQAALLAIRDEAIRVRDERIAALLDDLAQVRREYASVLRARLESLGDKLE